MESGLDEQCERARAAGGEIIQEPRVLLVDRRWGIEENHKPKRRKESTVNKIQTAAAKGGFKKGVWRWKVKTLTDPDAKKVDFHKHYAMTQAQIAALKSPGLTMKYKN